MHCTSSANGTTAHEVALHAFGVEWGHKAVIPLLTIMFGAGVLGLDAVVPVWWT